jgi:hypothetical protein
MMKTVISASLLYWRGMGEAFRALLLVGGALTLIA